MCLRALSKNLEEIIASCFFFATSVIIVAVACGTGAEEISRIQFQTQPTAADGTHTRHPRLATNLCIFGLPTYCS
jgi:hypothetical protein